MKKLSLLLAMLITGLNLDAQNVKLVNGLYQDENGGLFSGLLVTKNENSIKANELNVVAGKLDGSVTYYYPNGKVLETGSFTQGIKSGLWIRYAQTGAKTAWGAYEAGKKHGNWMVWDESGNKRFDMHYDAGQKAGVWSSWDEKGELIATNSYGTVN